MKCQAWDHLGVGSGNDFRKIGLNHAMKSIECVKKRCDGIILVTLVSVWNWIEVGETKPKKGNKDRTSRAQRRNLDYYNVNRH